MHRAPRIAIAISHFDGRRGGAELFTRSLAVFVVERGCDVHVVSRSVGPEERRLPVTHHLLPAVRGRLARAFAAALRPLVTDRCRRASLGRAARSLAERHTLRSTHEAVLRVYSEPLAASGIDPAFLDAGPPSLRRTA